MKVGRAITIIGMIVFILFFATCIDTVRNKIIFEYKLLTVETFDQIGLLLYGFGILITLIGIFIMFSYFRLETNNFLLQRLLIFINNAHSKPINDFKFLIYFGIGFILLIATLILPNINDDLIDNSDSLQILMFVTMYLSIVFILIGIYKVFKNNR